jgi:hypothetical protein
MTDFPAYRRDHVAARTFAANFLRCSATLASASAIRAIIGARQQCQIANANASAGVGLACRPRILVTIAVTCAVPITVETFCWANTRSMAMTSG